MSEYRWRRSSRSGAQGDNCVEVATNVRGVVAIRDRKDPNGPVLEFHAAQRRDFLTRLAHSADVHPADATQTPGRPANRPARPQPR
jgi:hypothetical protein